MNPHRQIKFFLFFAALTLVAPRVSQAQDTDALIKGTTDFLLDRANDNYMYVFERKLASNPILNTYLPETLRVAQAGDLRSLLTNRAIWEQAVKKDLVGLEKLDLLKSKIAPLVGKLCERASKPLGDLLEKICAITPGNLVSEGSFKLVQGLTAPNRSDSMQRATVRIYRFDSDNNEILAKALTDLIYDINRATTGTSACEGLGKAKSGNTYTLCVIEITSLLAAAAHAEYVVSCTLWGAKCDNEDRTLGVHKEDDDFDDFRHYALFFAQMADAKDPSTVKALLKSVTVPPVSFGIKREPHRTHVLITSYLGGAWARDKNENTFVLAVPVGVEISQAWDTGSSLSLLLSPIDFGYPLSLKLNGADTPVRASDILVPAAYVLWGTKNYPFAGGLGYARVKSVETSDKREGRLMLLLAFDMPLFKLR